MTAPSYRQTLLTYLVPQRTKVLALVGVLVATTGLQLVVPLIIKRFIDGALEAEPRSVLIAAGIAYLVAVVATRTPMSPNTLVRWGTK